MMPRAVPIPVRMLQATRPSCLRGGHVQDTSRAVYEDMSRTRPSCLRGGHVADMSAAWPWGGSDQAAGRPDVAQHDCEHDEGEDGRDRREGHPPLDAHDDVLVDDRVRDKRQVDLQRRAAALLTAGCCLHGRGAKGAARPATLGTPPSSTRGSPPKTRGARRPVRDMSRTCRGRVLDMSCIPYMCTCGTCLGRVVDVSRACRRRAARRPARRTTRACRRTPCR